ncbi:MAG: glycosyltransferase family 4 protein [Vicinamibacteria bacterium]|jgi:glycosyltransferase involved in cell wall biosynthesis|nr:glycosyltransferase family 4 protein [Vicinamibacteria bacterium]
MRILFVAPFFAPAWGYGGMTRASTSLANALVQCGHEVEIVTARLTPEDAEPDQWQGVLVRRFAIHSLPWRFMLPWPIGLRAYLQSQTFDVAHVIGFRHGFAVESWRALRRHSTPLIFAPHGTYPMHGRFALIKRLFDLLWGKRMMTEAAACIAVSQAEARDLPRSATVIPNGVDAPGSLNTSSTEEARAQRVIFIGTDAPQKRASWLIPLLDHLPQVRLTLVGRFRADFIARLRRFGDRVAVRGVLNGDALAQAYAEAALLLHPATGESFGLVPFEAALMGTAAVVAGGHGCGEWYGRAGGCVVAPDDQEAFIQAVAARLAQPPLAEREAATVARFAREHLCWDEAARATVAVYQEALAARQTQGNKR